MPSQDVVRIWIVHETEGFGAGSVDLLEFLLLAPTREEIEARLPEALAEHCGHPVAFKIMTPRNH